MRRRRAFTLLELIVVVIILSILAGLGAITYASTQSQLTNGAAGANLSAVVSAEEQFANDYGTYTPWPADLASLLPRGFQVVTGDATTVEQVSIAVGSDGTLGVATRNGLNSECLIEYVTPMGNVTTTSVAGPVSTLPSSGVVTASTIPSSVHCSGSTALPSGDTAITPASAKW